MREGAVEVVEMEEHGLARLPILRITHTALGVHVLARNCLASKKEHPRKLGSQALPRNDTNRFHVSENGQSSKNKSEHAVPWEQIWAAHFLSGSSVGGFWVVKGGPKEATRAAFQRSSQEHASDTPKLKTGENLGNIKPAVFVPQKLLGCTLS